VGIRDPLWEVETLLSTWKDTVDGLMAHCTSDKN
jgi:hypothetical protein